MRFIEVSVTCPSNDVAQRIAAELVESRLVACANIHGQVQSIYRWQGDIERETEVPLVLKTREDHFDRVAARIAELHPYDTPAILALPIARCNPDCRDWLVDATEGAG